MRELRNSLTIELVFAFFSRNKTQHNKRYEPGSVPGATANAADATG